jgi:Family of unknown function (DUF6491)
MNLKEVLLAGSILALAACASVDAKRFNYADYAGAPIPELRFQTGLHNWQRIDDASLVVWTRPSEAYLLTLRTDCNALQLAKAVVIDDRDGTSGRMVAGSTDVLAGPMRCRIETIRPIDLKRLESDRKS